MALFYAFVQNASGGNRQLKNKLSEMRARWEKQLADLTQFQLGELSELETSLDDESDHRRLQDVDGNNAQNQCLTTSVVELTQRWEEECPSVCGQRITELEERLQQLEADMSCSPCREQCQPASITYRSREVSPPSDPQEIINLADGGSPYCEKELQEMTNNANYAICGTSKISNYVSRFVISFTVRTESTYTFKVSRDHDQGTVWMVDDVILRHDPQGPASNDEPHSFDLKPGQHTLKVYGSEGCCDGDRTDNGFTVDGGDFLSISVQNLDEIAGCA